MNAIDTISMKQAEEYAHTGNVTGEVQDGFVEALIMGTDFRYEVVEGVTITTTSFNGVDCRIHAVGMCEFFI